MIRVLKPSYLLFYLFCHVLSDIAFCFRNRREIYLTPGMLLLAWGGLANVLVAAAFVLGGIGLIILALLVNIGLGLGVLFVSPLLTFCCLLMNSMAALLIGALADDNNKAGLIRLRKQEAAIRFALSLAHLEVQNGDVIDPRDKTRTIFARLINTDSGVNIELPEGPQYFEAARQRDGFQLSFTNGYGFDYRRMSICDDLNFFLEGGSGKRVVLERVWSYLRNRLRHPFKRPQVALGGMFLQRGSEVSRGYGLLSLDDYLELVERELPGDEKKRTSFPVKAILEAYDPDVPVSYVKAIYEPVPYNWEYVTDELKSDSRWTFYFKKDAASKDYARLSS